MKKQRPGSWSVLIASMAASYALARWLVSRIPTLFTPVSLLITFLTERYREEIDFIGNWVSKQFKSIWKLFQRRTYATKR